MPANRIPTLTPSIIDRFRIPAERVANWNALPLADRQSAYQHGLFEVRSAAAQERGAGHRIVAGHTGPGASLATAVDYAWNRAESERAESERQARANRTAEVPDHDAYMAAWTANRAERRERQIANGVQFL